MRRVCVFCGSKEGNNGHGAAAAELGRELAARGLGLVYGGGHSGLMGIVADSALRGGGEVWGVIPRDMVERRWCHAGLTRLIVVDSMHERKQRMHEAADGFIALPGGYGTMDELFEALAWLQLGFHNKPVGILNSGAFYDPLLAWLERACGDGLLADDHRALLRVAAHPRALLDLLLSG